MRSRFLLVLLALAIAVRFASADTIILSNTNTAFHNRFPDFNNIGTVTLTQVGANVDVVVAANIPDVPVAFVLPGENILFNTSATLSASNITNFQDNGSNVFALESRNGRGGFGKFKYDITSMTIPHYGDNGTPYVFFTITNITLAQLQPYKWGVHFCILGGGNNVCSGITGYASNALPSTVPEPGTLSLLSTGLVGLAGFFRRRFVS